MAERRMFAKTIIDSDAFLDMPLSTQSLYFHLSMRADDDGFVNNAKKIQRMLGCNDDDLKILLGKNFIIPFENGVCVIKHWLIHNYIQKDRYKPTVYKDLKDKLSTKDNRAYSLDTQCIQFVDSLDTQVRLGKDRLELDKASSAESKIPPCPHQAIIDIYHQTLPELPKVISWNKTREAHLKQRWRELFTEFECKSTEEALDWFKNDFFQFIKNSKFLTGRTQSKDRRPFLADLEWVIKPTNFTKIIERKYL
jgi:hypothetical protein